MHVNDIWDIFGAVLTIALIAMVLTKSNTAGDVTAVGTTFDGAIKAADAG